MNIIERTRLVDVLAAWGKHEAIGRSALPITKFEGEYGFLLAIEYALHVRSPMLAKILDGHPVSVLKIEIDSTDIPSLRLADTRSIEKWKLAAPADPKGYKHYRALADSSERVEGPLICTAQTDGSESFVPPITIFDGWHRIAGWTEQVERDHYPISAYLIVTNDPVPLFPSPI